VDDGSIRPEPVQARFSVPSPILSLRIYFSTYHLWAARHFAQLTAKAEAAPGRVPRFEFEHRALATNTILSAVAFLEAAINELFQDASDAHPSYVQSLKKEGLAALADAWDDGADWLNILTKYQLACRLVGVQAFDRGVEPFQSAKLLIQLRNALVHYKPSSRSAGDETSLEQGLSAKFAPNHLMEGSPGNPYFPDKCLGAGCTMWAVYTVEQFATEFFARIGVQPNFQRSQHRGTGA
jgi:hypothetical protein